MRSEPAVWFPAVRAGTGTDVFTRRLCEALNAKGIRAEISWLPQRAEFLPWTVRRPKLPEWANVVHVNTWLHPRFIPRGVPVVATLHHAVHDPALRPYKGWWRATYHGHWIAPIERRVMRRAQRVVAVSSFAADMARQTLCDIPLQVIRNGIDTVRFRPAGDRISPHHPLRLLYVGSWMARKGVDLLAPIMRELGDGFVLYCTRGSMVERDKAAIPPNMIDMGRLSGDQVVAAMQRADVFLFPSRSEGFGLVAAEAMACGLPVVATRGSSLPEVVEDGVTGVLCPQDDVAAFARAIRRLADPALWRRMSANAVVRARDAFSKDVALDAYCGVYRDAISKFGRSER